MFPVLAHLFDEGGNSVVGTSEEQMDKTRRESFSLALCASAFSAGIEWMIS